MIIWWPNHLRFKEDLTSRHRTASLTEAFNYISTTEKDVLTEALRDFKGADMEEVLSRLLLEIAHNIETVQQTFSLSYVGSQFWDLSEPLSANGLGKIWMTWPPKARRITNDYVSSINVSCRNNHLSSPLEICQRNRAAGAWPLTEVMHSFWPTAFLSRTTSHIYRHVWLLEVGWGTHLHFIRIGL